MQSFFEVGHGVGIRECEKYPPGCHGYIRDIAEIVISTDSVKTIYTVEVFMPYTPLGHKGEMVEMTEDQIYAF